MPENRTLEEKIVMMLKDKGFTLSTAESCTAGMIAAKIVNVSGASAVFTEGFVTYSEEAKMRRLSVKEETLQKFTAVSSQTAQEMAEGGCKTAGTDVCIAVTGYAGPEGGTDEHPVGTVYVGCCICGDVRVRECHFAGDRSAVRTQAADTAMEFLIECLYH